MPELAHQPISRLPTASQWWKSSGNHLSIPLLAAARGKLQTLLTLPADEWTPVSVSSPSTAQDALVQLNDQVSPDGVQLHSVFHEHVTVYRSKAVLRCPVGDAAGLTENLMSALTHPALLPQWAQLVEGKRTIARPRADVTVERVTFRTGWPIAPVEALTINQTWRGTSRVQGPLLLRVSTCLPRPDGREMDAFPAFLHPQPPYVRRRFDAAWTVEQMGDALCITLFWSDDFSIAPTPAPAPARLGRAYELHTAMMGLISFLTASGTRAGPTISSWGRDVRMQRVRSDADRSMLKAEYTVAPGDASQAESGSAQVSARAVHLLLASDEKDGWDITCSAQPPSVGWKILVCLSPHQAGPKEVFILHESEVLMRLRIKRTKMVPTFEPGRVRVNGAPVQVWPSDPLAPMPPSTLSPKTEQTAASVRSFSVISTLSSLSRFSSGSGEKKDETVVRYPAAPGIPTPSTASEAAELLSSVTAGIAPSSPHTWEEVFSLLPNQKADLSPPLSMRPGRSGPSAALSASIQRTYIYFMSLLEMPDRKWSALPERTEYGVGVSMSQLRNALDSRLVVYRAQATFVGLSIWDWLSCLSGPGAGRQLWDETLESAELLEDWGPCSSLWREKTKGWWPVSARGSLLVQTTYKSPNSIHVFSFTPSLDLIAPDSKAHHPCGIGTIQTQVDLRGWCIEQLSPTTVRVVLMEQSNPNGWTRTATAVPAAMASAVGGVGHSALQSGPPPFLVGLSHGLIRAVQYDPKSFTSSLCYAPQGVSHAHIRCDPRGCAKSGGVEVEVHPPPRRASCLHRHRLHPRGGGTWLTFVHETKVEVRVRVRPLRHFPGASPDDAVKVLLNGEPMRVVSDELSSTRILDLTSAKRTTLLPLALDRGLPMSHSRASSASASQLLRARRASECGSTRTRSSSLSAHSVATPTTLVSAPSEKGGRDEDFLPVQSCERDAMSGALDVLFLLRRVESNLPEDPATTRAGWASVAPLTGGRRGIHISRKTLPSFSSRVAVVRADMIIPHEAAMVMAAVQVSSSSGGSWWDSVCPMAQFGSGAGVAYAIKDHLPWPFSKRFFCLGSLSAVSSRGSYIFATASCSLESIERLIPFTEGESKLNPRGLPVGHVLLDGWILQPCEGGTRLTHLLAWDWGSSVPASMKAWYNLSLLNERLAKLSCTLAQPIPHFCVPMAMVQVRGDPREPTSDMPWTLSPNCGVTVLEHSWTRVVCLFSAFDALASGPEEEDGQKPVLVFHASPGYSAKVLTRPVRGRAVNLDAPFSGKGLPVRAVRSATGPTQIQVFLSEQPSSALLIECTLTDVPAGAEDHPQGEVEDNPQVEAEALLPVLRQDPNGSTYVPVSLRFPIGVHQNLFPRPLEEKVDEMVPSPVVQITPPPVSSGHKAILLIICALLSSLLYLSYSRSDEPIDLQGEWARLIPLL